MYRFVLFVFFAGICARADQISNYTIWQKPASQLVVEGFSLKKENGISTLVKNYGSGKTTIISSKDNEYVAQWNNMAYKFARFTEVGEGGTVKSSTLCTGSYKEEKKFTCRTQTASYCRALLTQVSDGFFSSDLSKLRECTSIVNKIKFNAAEIQAANDKALSVFKDQFQLAKDQIVNHIAKPTTIKDLLEDYSSCDSEKKWASSAETSARVQSTTSAR